MAEMAATLGIPQARYTKYETRTPIPHYLIKRFCAITNSDFEQLAGYRALNNPQRFKNTA